MASVSRLIRILHSGRTITKTLNPHHHSSLAPSPCLTLPLYNRAFEHDKHTHVPGGARPVAREFAVHTILAGLLGFGTLNVAYADNNEASASTPPPTEYGKTPPLADSGKTPPSPESVKTGPSPKSPPASTHPDLEEIARRDKLRLEALIRSKRHTFGSCPRFTVAIRGQKLTIRFKVPPSCEIPVLITSIVARLGVKAGDHGVGSDMMLRAWDSGLAWQLTLTPPKIQKDSVEGQVRETEKSTNDGELCILMFRPLFSADNTEIEFMKEGSFTNEELDALVSALELAGKPKSTVSPPRGHAAQVPTDKAISSLEAMGIKIYGLKQTNEEHQKAHICWDNIAGYDQQKREIEDTILLAIKSPEVYDDIARGTRCKFETNRPRAVLFDGPPGTGKTSCARIIANEGGVPLLYVPLEVIMSKYYGESERLLGKLFSLANEIPSGAIVFLDEVDSLATARDTETHEATRRLLSVLLRQIDGFEQDKKIVVVAATNRKQDLDPALLSRFDCMITFGLPDQQTREEIAAQYAKHLTKSELGELASATEEMSGRDIKDVCQQAERHWASKVIRGQTEKDEDLGSLPPLKEYIECALKRRTSMPDSASFNRDPNRLSKKPQFDFM